MRTRLAPTPSGFLHIGNALSFVVTWALARANSGWVLLRIDDLDTGRRRQEYLEDIFKTLDWLGLDYDAGPSGPDNFQKEFSQQTRLSLYQNALQQLKQKNHLFACTCSRKQIQAISKDGTYPGTCRRLQKSFDLPNTAWRLRVPPEEEVEFREWNKGIQGLGLHRQMGDFVVRGKNLMPAYQIASLMDDQYWEIDFIVRGEDLKPSTAAQMYLAKLLGGMGFQSATFWHHSLITGDNGKKLSKSEGAQAIKSWREQGKDPLPIYKRAAQWMNVRPEDIHQLTDLVQAIQIHYQS